jgi:hypothetical protein
VLKDPGALPHPEKSSRPRQKSLATAHMPSAAPQSFIETMEQPRNSHKTNKANKLIICLSSLHDINNNNENTKLLSNWLRNCQFSAKTAWRTATCTRRLPLSSGKKLGWCGAERTRAANLDADKCSDVYRSCWCLKKVAAGFGNPNTHRVKA